jgi:ribosomal protein S18 acetylase RimI-like enzyme
MEGGCIGFTLEVREGNRAARAMYESLGFRVEGKRPGYYEEEREDGIIMWWIPDWNQTELDGKGVGI